jgi:hypothetical protein
VAALTRVIAIALVYCDIGMAALANSFEASPCPECQMVTETNVQLSQDTAALVQYLMQVSIVTIQALSWVTSPLSALSH